VAALYDSNPKDLKNGALDAFYAALVAKLMLVANERISRHRILFLMSPPPTEADIAAAKAGRVPTSKSLHFRTSISRMEGLKERLTAELAALRHELDVARANPNASAQAPFAQERAEQPQS
jgi:hypothetical protein